MLLTTPAKSFYRPTSKVHIIGNDLAVGWAGNHLAAKDILHRLYNKFSETTCSTNDLETELSKIDSAGYAQEEVQLTGWISTQEAMQCFWWESNSSGVLHTESDKYFIGSGRHHFMDLRNTTEYRDYSGDCVTEMILKDLIVLLGHLTMGEHGAGDNSEQQFGYAFEAIYHDGLKFQFIESLQVATGLIHCNQSDRAESFQLFLPVYRYQRVNNMLVKIRYGAKEGQAFKDGAGCDIEVVSTDYTRSLHNSRIQAEHTGANAGSFMEESAQYSFLYTRLVKDTKEGRLRSTNPLSFVSSRDDEKILFDFTVKSNTSYTPGISISLASTRMFDLDFLNASLEHLPIQWENPEI